MASKQHYDVALRLGDLTHSSLALSADDTEQAERLARIDAHRTSGGGPGNWEIVSLDRVPAPVRRAA
ncbi:hypothetical protein [Roseococcus pinisoli]|uniref:Uncharacterized protein n=1 Tax=Roseococcus pinisoli TaxID=2835040 RepID=A0ABS5Q9Y3_9PROT|nr:hypothetical protein [Roseococcus pinisoli]MBS7810511.1 hypothetical protein [Roseococcus pinisoli]